MKHVSADDIKSLIQLFDESDWKELALQVEDFRIFISTDPNSAGVPWSTGATPAAAPSMPATSDRAPADPANPVVPSGTDTAGVAPVPDNCVVVKAPNLGIFYRSPKPGAPAYVEVGEQVSADTEVCLIEVMKLFTPVHAGLSGIVRHICAEDGDMVEHDQPLFYIELMD